MITLSDLTAHDGTTDDLTYEAAHREMTDAVACTCERMHLRRSASVTSCVGASLDAEDLDPDCELHFPWVIEDERDRRQAFRWWFAGYQTGYGTAEQSGREFRPSDDEADALGRCISYLLEEHHDALEDNWLARHLDLDVDVDVAGRLRSFLDKISEGPIVRGAGPADETSNGERFRIYEVGPHGQIAGEPLRDDDGEAYEFVAADGFGALCQYSEAGGFVPYSRANSAEEYERMMNSDEGVPAQYSTAHGAWIGVFTNYEIGAFPVRTLDARFDVTGLSQRQVDNLSGYVYAQAEGSNDDDDEDAQVRSGVPVKIEVSPDFPKVEPRTVLVHLNVEVPADDPRTGEQIIDVIEGGLNVAFDGNDELGGAVVNVALAEEI